MGFIIAVKFLTLIPIPIKKEVGPKELVESLPYFPLVGIALGTILFIFYYLLSFILPPPVIYALLIIILVILTGASHVDGLMDTFDGLVSGKSLEKRLEIMSDSRVGSFGITAAILLFLLKYTSLAYNPNTMITLLLMPTLSRWMMTSAIFTSPSAKNAGMGAIFKQGTSWLRFTISTIIALVISIFLLNWRGLILMAGLWIIISSIAYYFRSRFGGLTGDNFGAVNEIAEVIVVILLIIINRFLGFM